MNRLSPILLIVVVLMAGCQSGNQQQAPLFGSSGYNSNAYTANAGSFTPDNTATQQASLQANQLANLNSQLRQFDSDNQNLHAQVAALQQRLQNANSYNDQLKQQLSDQMTQLQQARVQLQQQPANPMQVAGNGYQTGSPGYQNAGYQLPGTANAGYPAGTNTSTIPGGTASNVPNRFAGATIRANNSLMGKLQTVQLPGFKAWMDGDVIRIEGPTDRLFISGTYQVNPNDAATITSLANTIRQNFPRQVIGVEAHWDGTPIEPATTSHHQLTATQALAVFDLLVKSGLPHSQVFTMAMGSNRLRYPSGNAANRRIEIVIYPETF